MTPSPSSHSFGSSTSTTRGPRQSSLATAVLREEHRAAEGEQSGVLGELQDEVEDVRIRCVGEA